jgi:hypothetical protein
LSRHSLHPITQTETTTLTYEGPPAQVSALAQFLREEGLTVDYEAPEEGRDLTTLTGDIVVGVVVSGTSAALLAGIRKATKRLRSWFPNVKVEGKHRADDDG